MLWGEEISHMFRANKQVPTNECRTYCDRIIMSPEYLISSFAVSVCCCFSEPIRYILQAKYSMAKLNYPFNSSLKSYGAPFSSFAIMMMRVSPWIRLQVSPVMSMPFQGDSLQFPKNNIFSEGAGVAVPRPRALPHFMGPEVQPASHHVSVILSLSFLGS